LDEIDQEPREEHALLSRCQFVCGAAHPFDHNR
jgi:hypothetical protein